VAGEAERKLVNTETRPPDSAEEKGEWTQDEIRKRWWKSLAPCPKRGGGIHEKEILSTEPDSFLPETKQLGVDEGGKIIQKRKKK